MYLLQHYEEEPGIIMDMVLRAAKPLFPFSRSFIMNTWLKVTSENTIVIT